MQQSISGLAFTTLNVRLPPFLLRWLDLNEFCNCWAAREDVEAMADDVLIC